MPIPASIEKFLTERGIPFQALTHRKAYTAQEEAAVAHVPQRGMSKARARTTRPHLNTTATPFITGDGHEPRTRDG